MAIKVFNEDGREIEKIDFKRDFKPVPMPEESS